MIPELGTSARGRLDAGVRRHANEDDLLDAALLEVEVEVSISNAVLAPMRLDHDVARLRCQFRMPLTAPGAFCEDGASVGQNLQWARMPPSVIIALAPARVRDVEYCNAYAARGLEERAQMRQQVDRLSDRLDVRPEFAPSPRKSCTDRRAASRSGSRYSRQVPKVLSLAFCPGIMGRAGAVAVVKRLDLCHVNETDRRSRAWVRGGSAPGNLPEPQPASVPWCFPVRPDLVPCSAELIPCSAT